MSRAEIEGPLSATHDKYAAAAPQTHHVTIEEAETLAVDLARLIAREDRSPDLVVGLANGAFLPTRMVADTLGVPWFMVKVRRKGTRYKQRLLFIKTLLRIPPGLILWGPFRAAWVLFQKRTSGLEEAGDSFDFDVRGKRVLIVDDCVETGSSIRYVADKLRAAGADEVRSAVYCWADMPDPAVIVPDVHLHRSVQFYPWSNNSRHLADFTRWMARHGLSLWT